MLTAKYSAIVYEVHNTIIGHHQNLEAAQFFCVQYPGLFLHTSYNTIRYSVSLYLRLRTINMQQTSTYSGQQNANLPSGISNFIIAFSIFWMMIMI